MPQFDVSTLLSPFKLGDLSLHNRIVMGPLTRSRSNPQGVPPNFAADYYAQRASAGLILSEATNISPQAKGYEYTPGIWSDEQVASWRTVTEAVHQAGGRIFLQLWHTGRMSHPDVQENHALPVSASAIRPEGQAFTADGMKDYVTPRPLETDEIPAIVEDYRKATLNAREAGFDGVEIHAANNYLLDQFVRDSLNKRTDRYGGSVANRLRFPLEVARAVVGAWSPDRVGIRLSPVTEMPGNTPRDSDVMGTYGTFISALSELGLCYLHMVEGTTQTSRDIPAGIDLQALRRRFHGAYMANNRYTPELAAETIRAGDADLVAFGRPYLANPDFVERVRRGGPFAPEPPREAWYGGGAKGYTDWPALPVSTTVS
ncbi:MAG: alkene reductase [Rhodospirillales bacterium 20-64-7]|nr:MAG: alkene reductase [Rhodospirillales bacterium 20-64-7]HQT79038.1 alkene reductase [Rhodopila sp.]